MEQKAAPSSTPLPSSDRYPATIRSMSAGEPWAGGLTYTTTAAVSPATSYSASNLVT